MRAPVVGLVLLLVLAMYGCEKPVDESADVASLDRAFAAQREAQEAAAQAIIEAVGDDAEEAEAASDDAASEAPRTPVEEDKPAEVEKRDPPRETLPREEQPRTRPPATSSSSSKEAELIHIARAVALAQTLPTGTAMGFSIDYELRTPSATQCFWAVEARGKTYYQPVQLQREGNLSAFIPELKPNSGPYHTYFVDRDRRRISNRIEAR